MRLGHLIYLSESTLSGRVVDELAELHATANYLNAKVGVTGLLLYNAGQFLQILEGQQRVLEMVFQKIERDPRHTNVCRLVTEPIGRRLFPRWNMGVVNVELSSEFEQQRFVDLIHACRTAPRSKLVTKLCREFANQLTCKQTDDSLVSTSKKEELVRTFQETYEEVVSEMPLE
jgi:hypothetical protein